MYSSQYDNVKNTSVDVDEEYAAFARFFLLRLLDPDDQGTMIM